MGRLLWLLVAFTLVAAGAWLFLIGSLFIVGGYAMTTFEGEDPNGLAYFAVWLLVGGIALGVVAGGLLVLIRRARIDSRRGIVGFCGATIVLGMGARSGLGSIL